MMEKTQRPDETVIAAMREFGKQAFFATLTSSLSPFQGNQRSNLFFIAFCDRQMQTQDGNDLRSKPRFPPLVEHKLDFAHE